MKNYRIRKTDGEPSEVDKHALVKGLLSHHEQSGHPRKTDVFSAFIHNESDEPIGGILISILWDGMHIDSLWVDESCRGKGFGKQLLTLAENEARNRGCKVAYTDTFTWQALDFYKKMGYTVCGELKDFPEGYSLTYIQKRL